MQQMYPNPNFEASIAYLRTLPPGWYDGQGLAIPEEFFNHMYLLLDRMKEIEPFKAPIMSPCEDGGLSLCWNSVACEIHQYEELCLILSRLGEPAILIEQVNATTLLEAANYLLDTQGVRCTNKLD
jgi:hypothetical protein